MLTDVAGHLVLSSPLGDCRIHRGDQVLTLANGSSGAVPLPLVDACSRQAGSVSDDDRYWPNGFSDELFAWAETVSTEDSEPGQLLEMCRRVAGEITANAVARPRQAHSEAAGQMAAFEARLEARWGRGLDLADLVVDQAFESGSWVNDRLRGPAATSPDDQYEALIRLHGKAVMTAREVMVLLRSGYSTGALARWRTLHEVWVVFLLLVDGDEELSRRYLAHEGIETLKGQKEYEETWEAIGLEPPDWNSAERDEIRAELMNEFGPSFRNNYGWAAPLFEGNAPTFKRLQERAKLDHWRGFYRMASHGTHATPKGTVWNIQSPAPTGVVWAGPSGSGLADPAQCTLIALTRITAELLAHAVGESTESGHDGFPDQISVLIRFQSTLVLVDHAIDELAEAHAQQEAEEEAISDLVQRALTILQTGEPMTAEDLAAALDVEQEDLEDALATAADRGELLQETLYRRRANG